MDPVSPRQDRGAAPVNTVHSRKYNTDKMHLLVNLLLALFEGLHSLFTNACKIKN